MLVALAAKTIWIAVAVVVGLVALRGIVKDWWRD
jgi:hypothetical protein